MFEVPRLVHAHPGRRATPVLVEPGGFRQRTEVPQPMVMVSGQNLVAGTEKGKLRKVCDIPRRIPSQWRYRHFYICDSCGFLLHQCGTQIHSASDCQSDLHPGRHGPSHPVRSWRRGSESGLCVALSHMISSLLGPRIGRHGTHSICCFSAEYCSETEAKGDVERKWTWNSC